MSETAVDRIWGNIYAEAMKKSDKINQPSSVATTPLTPGEGVVPSASSTT